MVSTLLLQSLIIAFIFSVITQFSDHISLRKIISKEGIVGFAAGLSISYLFLILLPQSLETNSGLRHTLFLFMLIGFALFRLGESYAYKTAKGSARQKELKFEHHFAFFLYNLVIGVTLVFFLQKGLRQGILFSVPIMVHLAATSLVFSELHGHPRHKRLSQGIGSFGSMLGVLLANFFVVSPAILGVVVGIVVGALFYMVIKELVPSKGSGQPQWFIAGIATLIIIEFLLRLVLI